MKRWQIGSLAAFAAFELLFLAELVSLLDAATGEASPMQYQLLNLGGGLPAVVIILLGSGVTLFAVGASCVVAIVSHFANKTTLAEE